MYVLNDGEILLKETYGSRNKKRFYIKPPVQRSVVVFEEEYKTKVSNWFAKFFLPQGYPDSVSSDYISYQIWDTAQAFCSTITGTLATKEVLTGVGVGDIVTTPLAATFTWVTKEACGHLGRMVFSYTHGSYLDAYSKRWRLFADILNDIAMCMELALPLFNNYTTIILCTSTVLKAIVGVAGVATRAALTQHHAIRGNMADVAAKDAAQETAVNLVASIAALFLMSFSGYSKLIFLLMVILHIFFNYLAVKAVCLKTLNQPRFLQLIDCYIRKNLTSNPYDINQQELILSYLGSSRLERKICGYEIKMGHSVNDIIKYTPTAVSIKDVNIFYQKRNYILIPLVFNNSMYVLIKEGASTEDLLCAYFHAVLLSIVISSINNKNMCILDDNQSSFARTCTTLQSVEWKGEKVEFDGPDGRVTYCEPSHKLISFVDSIVSNFWNQFRTSLLATGWNISKHLLVVDEWRIAKIPSADEIPLA